MDQPWPIARKRGHVIEEDQRVNTAFLMHLHVLTPAASSGWHIASFRCAA
jgi:hypothetical protein